MKRAVAVLLVVLGCSPAKTNDLPAEAWSADEYATAGLRTDAPWTTDDIAAAASTLKDVTAGHRERLPRYHGAKSGTVFARIVEDPPEAGGAVADRFVTHWKRYEALNAISKLYVENELATPTREWIELMGALLREATALAAMSDEFLATFAADDPSRPARLEGFEKMKAGFGMMLLGSMHVAGDKRVPEADRVALVQHATRALPTLFPLAPADTQRMLREQIAKLLDAVPKSALRDAINAAQQAIPTK